MAGILKTLQHFFVGSVVFAGSCTQAPQDNSKPVTQKPICHNNHPAWSPKGDKIVFDGRRGEAHEIFIYDIKTGKTSQLTRHPGRDAHPYWSPTGEKIVFQSPRASQKNFIVDIYVMTADGSNVLRLTENPGFSGVPAWSPDGGLIAFQFKPMDKSEDFASNRWNLYTIKPEATNQKRLTITDADDQVPGWAPDSRSILFHSDRTGSNQLYTMDIDGSDVKQITFTDFANSSGSFSPDGKRIAYKSTQNETRNLYVMNRDGSNPQLLAEDYNVHGVPSWSPDSQNLVFHSNKSGNGELYRVDIETGVITKLTSCE